MTSLDSLPRPSSPLRLLVALNTSSGIALVKADLSLKGPGQGHRGRVNEV